MMAVAIMSSGGEVNAETFTQTAYEDFWAKGTS
jgi:hypothetical protein